MEGRGQALVCNTWAPATTSCRTGRSNQLDTFFLVLFLISFLNSHAFYLQGLHSSLEALPDLLGGEWGKGGLVVAAEEGISCLANAFRDAKSIAESALLPIANKVVADVKVKAKIAQNAFEAMVMGVMDLVEEVGATMGGLGGGGTNIQNGATAKKDESEVTSSSVPTSVDPSQPSAEEAAVPVVAGMEVGVKEPEGADGVKKEVDKVEKEEMVEPTKTGGSV